MGDPETTSEREKLVVKSGRLDSAVPTIFRCKIVAGFGSSTTTPTQIEDRVPPATLHELSLPRARC
jgi:hypothetical protein